MGDVLEGEIRHRGRVHIHSIPDALCIVKYA
jgi:hypothetical protein